MNSPDAASALYAGAPDAAGQMYDAHADALFQYCWLTLRDRQDAHTAVCDALVQAGARVAELSDPATLRAWLFTLVQAECHYHPLPSAGHADEPTARPQQHDAALRIMAWNSVMSLDGQQRQALDLATRHGMTEPEIGLILGLPLPGATELLATARQHLERALGAEILVSRDSRECPGRPEAIHGWTGIVTPEFRERLLAHAGSCAVCQPRLPRNVSAGRIFGLLPTPALDREGRTWVISRVTDLVRSRAAEADPAVARVDPAVTDPMMPEPAAAAGPGQSAPPVNPGDRRRRRRRLFAGVGTAVATVGVVAGLAFASAGGQTRLSGPGGRLATGTAAPSPIGTGRPIPRPGAPLAAPGRRGQKRARAAASSPAAAGGSGAVASGKHAGTSTHGASRTVTVPGQVNPGSVTVALVPSTDPASVILSPGPGQLGNGQSAPVSAQLQGGSGGPTPSDPPDRRHHHHHRHHRWRPDGPPGGAGS